MKVLIYFWRNSSIILLLSAITICYIGMAFCGENRIIKLENKILSYVSKDSDKILIAIDEIDTLSSDEVVTLCVRLSDYFLGELPSALLMEKITRIGERILPYLVQKRNMPLDCKKKYYDLCYKSIAERNARIGITIEGIKEGLIFYTEFPENLTMEAQKYLKTIQIFIEDYGKTKGIYPRHLFALREYAWKEYGYKIKILNPWGQPYMYSLSENNDKYRLEIGADSPFGWPRVEGKCYTGPAKEK